MSQPQKQRADRGKEPAPMARRAGPVNQGPEAILEEPDLLALQRALADPTMATVADTFALQRRYGNWVVQRLLAQCQSGKETGQLRPRMDVYPRAWPKQGDISSSSNGSRVDRQIVQMTWWSRFWATVGRGITYTPVAGGSAWLWKKKGAGPTELIISAHGGYRSTDAQVNAPTSIKFYSTLNDSAARYIYDYRGGQQGEARTGDPVEDYILSKFQEKHSGGEELYRDVCNVVTDDPGFAVLTIRGGKQLRYSQMLGLMGNYSVVHAVHCRDMIDRRYVRVFPMRRG